MSTVLCSPLRKCIDNIVENMIENDSAYQHFDKNKSMFYYEVELTTKAVRSSPASHYARFADSLYDYLDKVCLTAIKEFDNKTLEKKQKKEFLRKIGFGVNETNFIDDYNGNYKLPERSVILMIKAIKLLDPDLLLTWPSIKTLGKHCISEQCQELVYKSALSFLDGRSSSYIPSIEINRAIKNTTKYDAFLMKCYEHMCSENSFRNIKAEELANTIIHGPSSSVASSTLLDIFKEDPKFLQDIAKNERKSVRLADFAARTRITDELIPIISVSTEPKMIKLIEMFVDVSNDFAKIQSLMTFNSGTILNNNNNNLLEYLKALTAQKAFVSYSKIDKHLVNECLKKMRDDCYTIMGVLQLPNITETKKIFLIKTTLIIIKQCQPAQHDGVIYDFEPFLDAILSLFMLEARDYEIIPEILGLILVPTFSKITKSNLKKFLAILEKINSEESMNKFSEFMIIFLHVRMGVEDMFWESLNSIYEFYQENQLDVDQIIQIFLVLHGGNLSVKMLGNFLKFCAERKLLSKTSEKLAYIYEK